MAKTPYLHRRGNNFYFRVTVPSKLRPFLGCREIVKTLKTQNHNDAVPLALLLGSQSKSLFNKVRVMSEKKDHSSDIKELFDLLVAHDEKNHGKPLPTIEGLSVEERAIQWRREFNYTRDKEQLQDQIIEQKLQHIAEMKHHSELNSEKEKSVRETLESLPDHLLALLSPSSIVPDISSPMLSEAIAGYIEFYESTGKKVMLGKIKQQLPMFLELVGDKPVHELKKSDVTGYFKKLQKLPKSWSYKHNKGMTLEQIISENEGKEGLAEGTVKRSYRPVLSGFFNTAPNIGDLEDFPTLSIGKGAITYKGNKPIGHEKQRAMTPEELCQLFEGTEMREFAKDTTKHHMYWLPHIGLYTGARINEICQLNPQSDILEKDGIWHFNLTEDTDTEQSDDEVEKSIKNHKERRVPVHSQLIALGLIDYIKAIKKRGASRLFPDWKPVQGKSSSKADDWFLDHIRAIKLRDETPFKRLVGFHAFRHTFINHAYENDIEHYYVLTGHDDNSTSKVLQGYRGNKGLPKLQAMMDKFNFDIDFIKPVM